MPRHVASDNELMQAAARGDEAAFSELMQRHRSWVRSLVRAFVRDDQADDLTQETFCRVHQRAADHRAQRRGGLYQPAAVERAVRPTPHCIGVIAR